MLIQSFNGSVHKPGCYAIRGRRPLRAFAGVSDVPDFLRARRLEAGRCCLRELTAGVAA